MKICRFLIKNNQSTKLSENAQNLPKFGILENETVRPLSSNNIFNLKDLSENERADQLEPALELSAIKFLPVTTPSKIVCVGRNYVAHARELGNQVPAEPLLFLKAPSALLSSGEAIRIPAQSSQVEHEGELAIIIGRIAKKISDHENPFDYVCGYTLLNDVTARDLQRSDVQFTRAKSFDTFCPIGDFIKTDLDPAALNLRVTVNGALRQTGNTSEMVFSVGELIQYISRQMTLLPGDIIASGTPSGVSQLKPGDVCRIEIEDLGVLENPVESEN